MIIADISSASILIPVSTLKKTDWIGAVIINAALFEIAGLYLRFFVGETWIIPYLFYPIETVILGFTFAELEKRRAIRKALRYWGVAGGIIIFAASVYSFPSGLIIAGVVTSGLGVVSLYEAFSVSGGDFRKRLLLSLSVIIYYSFLPFLAIYGENWQTILPVYAVINIIHNILLAGANCIRNRY